MSEHLAILKKFAEGYSPERTDAASAVDLAVVRELFDAGMLSGIDASSLDGPAYMDLRITLEGREYLRELEEQNSPAPLEQIRGFLRRSWVLASLFASGSVLIWASGVVGALDSIVGGGSGKASELESEIAILRQNWKLCAGSPGCSPATIHEISVQAESLLDQATQLSGEDRRDLVAKATEILDETRQYVRPFPSKGMIPQQDKLYDPEENSE